MKRLVLILLGGCTLYFNNPPEDDVVPPTPPPCDVGEGSASPAADVRDPITGLCAPPPMTCDACGGCDPAVMQASSCTGMCEFFDESTCLATAGCHAEYFADATGTITFNECWDIAPLAPVEGGSCSGLDAYTCARHDDCSSVLAKDGVNEPSFTQCAAESSCASLTDEASCLARPDCTAVYTGTDCTCDEAGDCTCENEAYDKCE